MNHVLGHTNEPIEKIFFQVVIDFNEEFVLSQNIKPESDTMMESISEDESSFESSPLDTYPQAEEIIDQMLNNICGKFPGSMVMELEFGELEQQEDEYYLCITDEAGEEIAKLGIIAIDYSDVTIH